MALDAQASRPGAGDEKSFAGPDVPLVPNRRHLDFWPPVVAGNDRAWHFSHGHCMNLRPITVLLALLLGLPAAAFDHAHAAWTAVLKPHVRDGLVDYAALKAQPRELNAYLDSLAAVPKADFERWKKPEQVAFLLNLYNASTLKLVADHHPVTSIKKIGGLLQSPWSLKVVRVWGDRLSLDEIEHEWLRSPRYAEPRIHFGLVCSAKSCPPLRPEAYAADRLDTQLEEQGRQFLRDATKNRFDAGTRTLWLSQIFEWFEADFTAGGKSVAEFVRPYLPEPAAAALAGGKVKVRYLDYDWSLNGR